MISWILRISIDWWTSSAVSGAPTWANRASASTLAASSGHVDAGLGPPLDDAQRLEIGEGLADLPAADVETLGELALGRHALARLVVAQMQEQHELRDEVLLLAHDTSTASGARRPRGR